MAILAQWWVSYRLFLSYDKLQNPHTHPERANTLIKYKIIYHITFISVSYFLSFWQVLSNLKNEWIFPKRGWMVWCLPQACFHYRQRSGCHETLIIKSSTSDWQAAGVMHNVRSLFCTFIIFFVTLETLLWHPLPSPLCAQWHNANVSGMVVASLHEWISAFWKANKWIKSSSIVWGVGKGLRLWGISGGCMTWRLHPAEPVDAWIPEIVL